MKKKEFRDIGVLDILRHELDTRDSEEDFVQKVAQALHALASSWFYKTNKIYSQSITMETHGIELCPDCHGFGIATDKYINRSQYKVSPDAIAKMVNQYMNSKIVRDYISKIFKLYKRIGYYGLQSQWVSLLKKLKPIEDRFFKRVLPEIIKMTRYYLETDIELLKKYRSQKNEYWQYPETISMYKCRTCKGACYSDWLTPIFKAA